MKLSPISLALVPLLTAMSASAAVYQVVDLGEVVDARATYATSVNDQGVAVLNGRQLYSVDIDISTIDLDSDVFNNLFTEEQRAELDDGVLTAQTHAILYNFLLEWPSTFTRRYPARDTQIANLVERYSFQPVSVTAAFIEQGQGVEPLRFRTTETEIGNDEQVVGQNNLGVQVGFATPPFEYVQFTRTTDPESVDEGDDIPEPTEHWIWQPNGAQRLGVVRVGDQRLTLTPVYAEFGGGSSAAWGISDEGLIIGNGSVGVSDNFRTAQERDCRGFSAPEINCYHFWHSLSTVNAPSYLLRAMTWQLEADLSVSEPEILGFLGDKGSNEPHPETELAPVQYTSSAFAVNNNGIIVGQSTYSDSGDIVRVERCNPYTGCFTQQFIYQSQRASLFIDGQVLPVFPAEDRDWQQSVATSINNNDIVVGYAVPTRSISGQFPRRMFYYDISAQQMVFPEDLFVSANTHPRAINDQGVVVGRTEAIVASVKRQRAFKYSIAEDSFIDLNTLLECDSPYTLVDATSINNSNEILATAVTEVPLRNSFGEVLLDEDGNPRTEFQARAVKLNPIANGEPSDCGVEDELVYDRKSATGSLWSALGLGLLLLWRRCLQRNG